mmetsp:Transcript_103153/g.291709  ORF Transcript_103153/g.291709 Transcript_103153/m.291709 type:complete len:111 (+) Transcript_103153:95-427(+)
MMAGAAQQAGPLSKDGLIQDVTPADRRAWREVAEYEVRSLPEHRAVYLKRGGLFFRSSKDQTLEALSTGVQSTSSRGDAPGAQAHAQGLQSATEGAGLTAKLAASLDCLE